MGNEKLAVEGGAPAVAKLGTYPAKIGRDELWGIVDMWDFSPGVKEKLHQVIMGDPDVRGPHLFRYYNPKPSRVEAAEAAMGRLIGSKHCLAVNSCTSALVSSLRALGVGAGDEVIVPGYTFFATAATVGACNALPVIVDVDDSLNMDPSSAERAITKRTKAIVPVHMRGAPAQMDAIVDLAKRKGLPVLEDVAQAGGGSFGGKRLGSIGTMGAFSLDYYKIFVSGEGGFVTTDDEWLFTRAQSFHDTAACWRPNRFARERRQGELFCGENYRMTELEGAVALVQIGKADEILTGLRRVKKLIKGGIDKLPGVSFRRITDEAGDTASNLVFFLPNPDVTRKAMEALKAEGVPAGGIYDSTVRDWHVYTFWDHIIQHRSVVSDGLPWSAVPKEELPKYAPDMCPRALDYLGRAILMEINRHWSKADCQAITNGINKVLRAYVK